MVAGVVTADRWSVRARRSLPVRRLWAVRLGILALLVQCAAVLVPMPGPFAAASAAITGATEGHAKAGHHRSAPGKAPSTTHEHCLICITLQHATTLLVPVAPAPLPTTAFASARWPVGNDDPADGSAFSRPRPRAPPLASL